MKILIVKTTSMGDVIHALPAVHDLSVAFPEAQIDWVVERSFSDIPRLSDHVSNVHEVAVRQWRKNLFSRQTWSEISRVRKRIENEHYDLVIDLQGLLKSAWIARWARSVIAGYDSESIKEPIASRFYNKRYRVSKSLLAMTRCRALTALALGYDYTKMPLSFGMKDFSEKRSEHPYAVFLVNTSRETKLWDQERWIALAKAVFQTQGTEVRLFWSSEVERQRVEYIAKASGDFCHVMPRLAIGECARWIQTAKFAIGVDTGLTHLAAATAVPTVGLFLDFPIELVGLSGEHVESLGGVGANPTVSDVLAALERAKC